MVRASVKLSAAVGVKVTVKVQNDAAATVVPQSSVSAKSVPTVLLLMVRAADPILRKMVVCGALVLRMVCEPNCREKGDIATAGAFVAGSIFATKASVCPPNTVWSAD